MPNLEENLEYLRSPEHGRILIASHRGKFGASVMENTVLAFLTAINQGADMVEIDISRTGDGVLIGLHDDNTLTRFLHYPADTGKETFSALSRHEVFNYYDEPGTEALETLDVILPALKGKTILVLDKCWNCPDDVYRLLDKYDMFSQTIFKFYIDDDPVYQWALSHKDVLYTPMVRPNCGGESFFRCLLGLKESCPVPAVEILPQDAKDALFQKSYISSLHDAQFKVWCNSLSISKNTPFGAGYDDLRSLRYGGDKGWGVLRSQGIDIIQTDWPYELKQYLQQ
jgi:glycerophosphoryl diester phosphodiesterase